MPRNTLADLHNILMEQAESLVTSKGEDIKTEIEKARSLAELATAINGNNKVMMEAIRLSARMEDSVPNLLISNDG